MSTYPQRVAENILPLSVASSLPEAFKEWYFTENTIDHGMAEEICGLCDKEELRYHFEIENEYTKNCLMVGSSCILKFNVSVYEDGELLDKTKARKKLAKLVEKMHQEACFKALEGVVEKENNDILKSALDYYRKNKYFTPKFAVVVLWRLTENQIDHNPSYFKVRMNRARWKNDIRDMTPLKIQTLWRALTSAQKNTVLELGHEPPNNS